MFRPYDLLVTTREDAEAEYFTISATGVMHIKKGEQSSFTSLGDWMKDEAMFNLISKIKYFRTYLIGRCFRRWHKVRWLTGWHQLLIVQHGGCFDQIKATVCNCWPCNSQLSCCLNVAAAYTCAMSPLYSSSPWTELYFY